tara:strand:- start:244 stop:627 length:384 start_codon:yes stop_codon:yes gene_type:complete
MYIANSILNELLNTTDDYFNSSYSQVNYVTNVINDQYVIEFIVPGYKKEYFKILSQGENHYNTVSVTCNPSVEQIKTNRYISKWTKTLAIPQKYDSKSVKATMSDGILRLSFLENNTTKHSTEIEID